LHHKHTLNPENSSKHVQAGGLQPLLDLLESKNGNLQHNAAFALYGLADNEDNIADIVRDGGVQRLQQCDLIVQVTCSLFYLKLTFSVGASIISLCAAAACSAASDATSYCRR